MIQVYVNIIAGYIEIFKKKAHGFASSYLICSYSWDIISANDKKERSEVNNMTASNSSIMKVVLSLLAVVSIVLIIVFAVNAGKSAAPEEESYDDLYVEDGEDALGNQELDDIYWDDSTLEVSGSDIESDSDF